VNDDDCKKELRETLKTLKEIKAAEEKELKAFLKLKKKLDKKHFKGI